MNVHYLSFPVWTESRLYEALTRADLCEDVTLPKKDFVEIVNLAIQAKKYERDNKK